MQSGRETVKSVRGTKRGKGTVKEKRWKGKKGKGIVIMMKSRFFAALAKGRQ